MLLSTTYVEDPGIGRCHEKPEIQSDSRHHVATVSELRAEASGSAHRPSVDVVVHLRATRTDFSRC